MSKNKFFKSTEEAVSMFLGLAIVLLVIGLVINFFNKRKDIVNLPNTDTNIELGEKNADGSIVGGEYIVKKGDNLWKIALNNLNDGYRWVEIAKLNGISNAGLIEVGQKLMLPTTVEKIVENKPSEYEIVKGDSLWKVAVRFYNDGYQWTNIYEANKTVIKNANYVEVGMKLVLP